VAPVDLHLLSDEELAKYYQQEEMARAMDQEDRDQEVARQYMLEEQIRQSAVEAQRLAQRQQEQSKKRCCRRLMGCLFLLLVVGGVGAALWIFLGGSDGVGGFFPSPEDFREEDPFNNANPEDANLWRTDNGGGDGRGWEGLELTVVNALDTNWHEFFNTAVSQWDNGTPDALTLSTGSQSPQPACNADTGVLKVCNGNYGDTNWRGINKVLLENNWIYSSAARMNEYYLTGDRNKDFPQMAYTMCHEIGHGFGLPHTDENFFNSDLGNCMDYTNNPEVNMQPATPNFNFLAQLYGTVDGSPIPATDSGNVQSSTQDVSGSGGGGGRRFLRKSSHATSTATISAGMRSVPAPVMAAFDDIDQVVDNWMVDSEQERQGWRKLHESEHGEAHEVDLGDGFVVQIHMLKNAEP